MQYRYRSINPATGVASAQGIDVSNWQGRFDWQGAKRAIPNLAFGVFRMTQGLGASGTGSPDQDAVWNHQQIAALGLRRMSYHFLDPRLSGTKQAQYFVDQNVKLGLTINGALWLDNETSNGVSPSGVAACSRDFMSELKRLRPQNPQGVYTFINFAETGNCAGLGSQPLWLAYPSSRAPSAPAPWSHWTFWQWGTRPVNGQSIDADAFNGTGDELDNWIASFHQLNPVTGFRIVKRGYTGFNIAWNGVSGATGYTAHAKRPDGGGTVRTVETTSTSCRLGMLHPGRTYILTVRAHPSDASEPTFTYTAKTKG